MSTFDDMVRLLSEINAKLGQNAGDRAGNVLNPPQNQQQKKPEDILKNNNSDLIRGFRDALNSVPIFSKINAALSGLTPVLRELLTLGTIVGTGKIWENQKIFAEAQKRLADADKAMKYYNTRYLGKAKINPATGLFDPIEESPEGIEYQKAKRKFEAAKKNLNEKQETHSLSRLLGIDDWKKLGSNVGKIIHNLGENSGGAGKAGTVAGRLGQLFAGGEGSTILATSRLLAIPGLIIGVGAALLGLAKNIADSQRSISSYNGQMAAAFAFSDVRQIFRDIQSANWRSDSLAKFLDAWNDLLDKWRPLQDIIVDQLLNLGTALAKAVTAILEWSDYLGAFSKSWKMAQGDAIVGFDPFAIFKGWGSHDNVPKDWQDKKKYPYLTDEELAPFGGTDGKGGKLGDQKSNAFIKACEDASRFFKEAQAVADGYKKFSDKGVSGAEFMAAAATWNYTEKDRAFKTLLPIAKGGKSDFR